MPCFLSVWYNFAVDATTIITVVVLTVATAASPGTVLQDRQRRSINQVMLFSNRSVRFAGVACFFFEILPFVFPRFFLVFLADSSRLPCFFFLNFFHAFSSPFLPFVPCFCVTCSSIVYSFFPRCFHRFSLAFACARPALLRPGVRRRALPQFLHGLSGWGGTRSQQEGLEKVEADKRERRRRLKATKITGDVNAERVEQLRTLRVKVPGSGTGEDLEGAKEVRDNFRGQ